MTLALGEIGGDCKQAVSAPLRRRHLRYGTGQLPVIAYLTSVYPALSHTFIRREIAALRARGLQIQPYSVRPGTADWGENVPSILGRGKARLLADAALAMVRAPGAALRSFLLAQRHREKGLRGWLWSLFHYLEALSLAVLLRKAGIDHLHSHFANSGATVGLLAATYLQIPWSLTLHGISELDPPAGEMLPDKIERADFVACASWFMRAQGMRLVEPKHWSKMRLVRCGVAVPPASAVQDGSKVRNFIAVGRLSAEKGYSGLVEALCQVRERSPDFSLRVIGDGPLRPEIEAQLAEAQLNKHVTLLGGLPEDQTQAEIAKADAFVLPSLMEGLPVVLLEAMAWGKPVIAPMVAGIPELIEPGVNGLLFRPGDWSHLAQAIERLLNDEQLAARIGKSGYERVVHEFAIDNAVLPLVNLYTVRDTPALPAGRVG